MGRYVGLLALLVGAVLAVNFTSDVLYARAIAAQADEADRIAIVATGSPERLPLTGLIRIPGARRGAAAQTAQAHDGTKQAATSQ